MNAMSDIAFYLVDCIFLDEFDDAGRAEDGHGRRAHLDRFSAERPEGDGRGPGDHTVL